MRRQHASIHGLYSLLENIRPEINPHHVTRFIRTPLGWSKDGQNLIKDRLILNRRRIQDQL